MPLYAYSCQCGARFDRYLPLAFYNAQQVHLCGRVAEKRILPTPVMGDLPGYVSPVSGRWIEGRKARMEDLKRTGCRPYEQGEKEAAMRVRAKEESDFDRAIEETVEAEVAQMPARKKELLAQEVLGGADVQVVRSTA
jgi:hypothetical protein